MSFPVKRLLSCCGFDRDKLDGVWRAPNRQRRQGSGFKVANAWAGQSWHNCGIAWEIGVFRDAVHVSNNDAPHRAVRAIGRGRRRRMGRSWKSFKGLPHHQLGKASAGVSAPRSRFEAVTAMRDRNARCNAANG
jgi:hypothetical protein